MTLVLPTTYFTVSGRSNKFTICTIGPTLLNMFSGRNALFERKTALQQKRVKSQLDFLVDQVFSSF